jgi:hypothetical protein
MSKFSTYQELIDFAKSQFYFRFYDKEGYYENHHIKPRNEGGTDEDGLVLLTLKEHVEAHYLYALEHEDNLRIAWANLSSCILIMNYKKENNYEKKKQAIEDFLKNDDGAILLENVKLSMRGREGTNKGKKFLFKHLWIEEIQNNNKPFKIKVDGVKFFRLDFTKVNLIENCPICHQPNSEQSFACCEEHEKEYEAILKEKSRKERKEFVSLQWKNGIRDKKEFAKKSSLKQKGVTNVGRFWITDGTNNKCLNKGDPIPGGWRKGKFSPGYKWNEVSKQKMSIRRSQTCYVHKEGIYAKEIDKSELQSYLDDGWRRGRNPKLERKHPTGYKQKRACARCWVTKDTEDKMIAADELDSYILNGWTKGRHITEEQKAKLKGKRNKYWITDGVNNQLLRIGEIIPVGYYKGRVVKKRPGKPTNKRWITNGIDNKQIDKSEAVPTGWNFGRKISENQKAKLRLPKRTLWITNGSISKTWPKNETVPAGWNIGRKM